MADDACSAPTAAAQSPKIIVCAVCGASCPFKGGKHKYCADCSSAVSREISRKANNKGVVGSVTNCARCETPVVMTGSRQKYCESCAAIARQESKSRSDISARATKGAVSIGASTKCAECASIFVVVGPGQKYCSENCKAASKRTGWPTAECAMCRSTFQTRAAAHIFCSDCAPKNLYEKQKVWLAENKEAVQASRLKWAENNPEKVLASRRAVKQSESYRRKTSEALKLRRKTDPSFVIAGRVRASIGGALKEMKAGRHWETVVGYTLADLMAHLQRSFLPGMTWENRDEWHIDHIVPVCSFKFESADDPEVRACWHLSNLRPLWAADNLSKQGRMVYLV